MGLFSRQKCQTENAREDSHAETGNILFIVLSLVRSKKNGGVLALTESEIQSEIENLMMIGTIQFDNQNLTFNTPGFLSFRSTLKEEFGIRESSHVRGSLFDTKIVKQDKYCVEIKRITVLLTKDCLLFQAADPSYILISIDLSCTAKVIATIRTQYQPLFRIACRGKDSAWISNNKCITLVDIKGIVHDTVTTPCQHLPQDISVTRQKEIIYSDNVSRAIKIIKREKSKTLLSTPWKWEPLGLHCTKSEDILVNIRKNRKHKIVRYRGKKIIQEVYKDKSNNLIFRKGAYVLMLAENNNGDICVSDLNAELVVVVNRKEGVRFRYDGAQAKRRKSFDPRCIMTDSRSQIIVTDVYNDLSTYSKPKRKLA